MTIYNALLEIMNDVGYVQKKGKVAIGNTKYSYAGEVELIKALRPKFIEHGVVFYCTGVENIDSQSYKTEKVYNGEVSVSHVNRVMTKHTFKFVHVETETSIEVCALGDGVDSGDKAAYKAATGALKYALRQTFIIETGDDPDKEASPEPVKKPSSGERRNGAIAKINSFTDGDALANWYSSDSVINAYNDLSIGDQGAVSDAFALQMGKLNEAQQQPE